MVGVFVGDQNSVQRFRHSPDLSKAKPHLASAKPRIDQDPGFTGFEVCAVARGATAQNSQTYGHAPDDTAIAVEGTEFLKLLSVKSHDSSAPNLHLQYGRS
jgi:hypothetical protein